MAAWAINGAIPCEIQYIEEFHEEPSLSVFVDHEDTFVEVHGLDETVRIFLTLGELGALIDALTGAEEFITEDNDGDTGDPGVGGEHPGGDNPAGAANSCP
jgi:hypothetical protein